MLPLATPPPFPPTQKINKLIAPFGKEKNIAFVDIWEKFANADGTPNRTLFHDSVHPNAQGYAVWAETLEPILLKLLNNN